MLVPLIFIIAYFIKKIVHKRIQIEFAGFTAKLNGPIARIAKLMHLLLMRKFYVNFAKEFGIVLLSWIDG